mmetsp:Transcript_48660/g.112651  ORF Transcript_48660/g.112651 Transcript_48660/m.112651 type:complete len:359 (-) Transcript_48660:148-1224(-)
MATARLYASCRFSMSSTERRVCALCMFTASVASLMATFTERSCADACDVSCLSSTMSFSIPFIQSAACVELSLTKVRFSSWPCACCSTRLTASRSEAHSALRLASAFSCARPRCSAASFIWLSRVDDSSCAALASRESESTVSTMSTIASRWRATSSDTIVSCCDTPSWRCWSADVCACTDSIRLLTDSKPLSAASCSLASFDHRTSSSWPCRSDESISATSAAHRDSTDTSRSENWPIWRWSEPWLLSASAPSRAIDEECELLSSYSCARPSFTSTSSLAMVSFTWLKVSDIHSVSRFRDSPMRLTVESVWLLARSTTRCTSSRRDAHSARRVASSSSTTLESAPIDFFTRVCSVLR